jgi:hypothetical protein
VNIESVLEALDHVRRIGPFDLEPDDVDDCHHHIPEQQPKEPGNARN